MTIYVRLCSYKFLYHQDRKLQHPSPISFENKCYIFFQKIFKDLSFQREWIRGGAVTQIQKKMLIT